MRALSYNNDLRLAMVTQDVLRESLTDLEKKDLTVGRLSSTARHGDLRVGLQPAAPRAARPGIVELGLILRSRSSPVNAAAPACRRTGSGPRPAHPDEPPTTSTSRACIAGTSVPQYRAARCHPRPLVPRHRGHLHLGGPRRQVDAHEGGYNDWTFARAERNSARPTQPSSAARTSPAASSPGCAEGPPYLKPRYRIEAAEAIIADSPLRDNVELMSFCRRQGKKVIDLEDASISTPDGRRLIEHLTRRPGPGSASAWWGSTALARPLPRTLAGDYPLTQAHRGKPCASAGSARNSTT